MSYTQTQLDALKAAYASGIRTVTSDGHSVTYASMAEMERAISRMERSLAVSGTVNHVNPIFDKGV